MSAVSAPAGVVDRVAVVVGNTVYTESEVLENLRITEFLNGEPLDTGPAARRAAAERLVDQQLIRNEMQVSAFPEPSAQDVEAMVQQFRKGHFRDDAEYRASLEKYAITGQQVRDQLRWQLTALRFTDQRFRPRTSAPAQQPPARASSSWTNEASRSMPEPSANRADRTRSRKRQAKSGAPSADVDEQLGAWLDDARSRTRIQFKKEAFE